MTQPRPTVLFVDDELALLEQFTTVLEWDGYDVLRAGRVDAALDLIEAAGRIDLAILDFQLPLEGSDRIPAMLKADGRELGLLIAERLRRRFPETPILFWSGSADHVLRARALRMPRAYAFAKSVGPRFVQTLAREILTSADRRPKRKAFLVHGHAEALLADLKAWLAREFPAIEPVVLREMRTGGETLIDKLESYAITAELVFVLLTPDDTVLASRADAESMRARQNVVFEMGYFFGRLGRKTGHVILLSSGEVELPSDIHGMVTIDVTNGVASAGAEIRREIDRVDESM